MPGFSETNVSNSFSTVMAGYFLGEGYLIYWHKIDALQTPTGWAPDYFAQQMSYRADAAFNAALLGAKGIVTVVGNTSAVPRIISRLPNDGTVPDQDTVSVPAISVAVNPAIPASNYELGSLRKWRNRRLTIQAATRDEDERAVFADRLGVWLDGEKVIPVFDHDAATLAVPGTALALVGELTIRQPSIRTTTLMNSAEAVTFGVLYNARLEYVD